MAGGNRGGIRQRHLCWRTSTPRALTLLELLIVVAILSLLLVIAVPAFKGPIEDSRLREASRQVNIFFAQAQARAREIGRPVAVWIERSQVNVNMATELYLAETPPPYAGDVFGAKAVVAYNTNDSRWEIYFDLTTCPSLVPSGANALVKDKDRFAIRFGSDKTTYWCRRNGNKFQFDFDDPSMTDKRPPPGFPPAGFWDPGSDGFWGGNGNDNATWEQSFNPPFPTHENDITEAGWGYNGNSSYNTDTKRGLPFQIVLPPRRAISKPLQLPAGVAIDLAFSGMGVDLPSKFIASPGEIRGLEFGGIWSPQVPGSATLAPYSGPVVIVISAEGSVNMVDYANSPTLDPTSPAYTIHLLIGRVDGTLIAQGDLPAPIPWSAAAPNVLFQYDKNLENPDCIWVSIGCRTGSLTTSENAWLLSPTGFVESMRLAREFAQSGQTMGGR